MTLATDLKAALPNLSQSDQNFANSLLEKFDKYGSFTSNMLPYVEKLIARAARPQVGVIHLEQGMAGVIALFDRARKHLKSPKINLQTPTGQAVSLSVAGANSRNPGYINVTDGQPFGQNMWFGRISPVGEWTPSRTAEDRPTTATEIYTLLNQLAADPAGVAAAHGRLTGRCCFCHGKQMTDPRSLAVGYGQVCAKKFGVEWGVKKAHTVFEAARAA
jgi:hypothetical protein